MFLEIPHNIRDVAFRARQDDQMKMMRHNHICKQPKLQLRTIEAQVPNENLGIVVPFEQFDWRRQGGSYEIGKTLVVR